jgi:hypothetical protein
MRQENKALFQDYEIKNWDYSPHIYKFLGAAAIFILLTLLVMGQTDMLTTRGCDSPMVSRVCQVIDTIYVGSTCSARTAILKAAITSKANSKTPRLLTLI